MITTRLISRALGATAVLNVGAGLASLVDPQLHARMMFGPEVVFDGLLLRFHVMLWVFVVAMGLGYAVAARDPERQSALLLAGAVGKLGIAVLWIELLLAGLGTPLLLGGIAWDGTLGAMFLIYAVRLLRRPKAGASLMGAGGRSSA